MLIKKFMVKNLYNHISLKFSFNEKINFLIGVNGSGKTSILRLIQGLLTPSFSILNDVIFNELILEIQDIKNELIISAIKDNETLKIKIKGIKEYLSLPLPLKDEDIEEFDIRKNQVFARIIDINAPFYLGLNRSPIKVKRRILPRQRSNIERERYVYKRSDRFLEQKILFSGYEDIEFMAYKFYLRLVSKQEALINQLQGELLLASFHYYDIDIHEVYPKIDLSEYADINKLENRKKPIMEIIEALDFEVKDLIPLIDSFFKKMNKLTIGIKEAGKNKKEFNKEQVELIINSNQIRRIEKLLSLISDYNEKIKKIFEPIKNYENAINSFFSETDKYINITSKGELRVSVKGINDVFIPLNRLSSGERQILIMLSYLAFNEEIEGESVFIIDEPELSLHLSWQELFVKSIIKVNPELQLILATHSPTIISEFAEGKYIINLDEKKNKLKI